jgi:glycosyltransferase involved in cell wall biosynthesis
LSRTIDVILPTFNRAPTLERAISSVLAQTYRELKLFIVDDGSTDGTLEVIKPFLNDPRVNYLFQDNRGVSAARNLGIKKSNNEWIAFLDSDDEWLPQKIEKQVSFRMMNPHYRFIHSNEIWVRNGLQVNATKKFDKSNNEIFKRSLETCLISPSTVMMKRDLCIEHGCFDERFVICEDYDLWLKILAGETVGFISDELIKKHGGHDDQLSTRYHSMDLWRLKALVPLLKNPKLSHEQKTLVHTQIEKKENLLRRGFLKHENTQGLNELLEILRSS